MIEHVHKKDVCPEWENPGRSSTAISMRKLLKSVGKTNEEIEWILQENDDFEEEEEIFKALSEA